MAYSTQRDFINVPPFITEDSAPSADDEETDCPLSSPPTIAYPPFLQDLINFWQRLSCKIGRLGPNEGGGRCQDDTLTSASECADSGVPSESVLGRASNTPRKRSKCGPIGSNATQNDVEKMLLRLESEGKLTMCTITELISKYQEYIHKLMTGGKEPEGGLKMLLDSIDCECKEIVEKIESLDFPEKEKNELIGHVNYLKSALKAFICESQRATDAMHQELQKSNFDRQTLQGTLHKLSCVEGKIMNLKCQASKANGLEKNMDCMQKELEKTKKNNQVLVQRLMMAKREQNKVEEKYKHAQQKLQKDAHHWRCKAKHLHEKHQRECLELQKWKIHCSKLSLELDRATERILKGHETKRKLYFAECMRAELEKQIEEMMAIIKQLSEQNPSGSSGKPKDCEKVLSNLLKQSKNTLQSILCNIRSDRPSQKLSCMEELETEIRNLQRELAECRAKCLDSDEIDKLREELEKCHEENSRLKGSDGLKVNEGTEHAHDDQGPSSSRIKATIQVSELIVLDQDDVPDMDNMQGLAIGQPIYGGGAAKVIAMGPQTGSSSDSPHDEIPLQEAYIRKQPLGYIQSRSDSSDVPARSGKQSSPESYDSESETHSSKSLGSKGMANLERLLQEKNETIDRLENQCSFLQGSISQLNEEKKDQKTHLAHLNKFERELAALTTELMQQGSLLQVAKDELKAQKDNINESKQLLQRLEASNATLLQENLRLHQENIDREAETERHIDNFKDEVKEYETLELETANARSIAENSRKEFNDKVRQLLEEKAKLEQENSQLTKELEGLDQVTDEVNAERLKNRKMEQLIRDLEVKLQAFQQTGPPAKSVLQRANYFVVIDKLEEQLDKELFENDKLRDEKDAIAKDVDSFKNLLVEKDDEITKLRRMAAARQLSTLQELHDPDSAESCQLSDKASYSELVVQLRTQLNSEKSRYFKLRTKFIEYSSKVEGLEKLLRDKKDVLEREFDVISRSNEISHESIVSCDVAAYDPRIVEGSIKSLKDDNKRILAKLVINFMKNLKLESDYKRALDIIDELESECNAKEEKISLLKSKLRKLSKLRREYEELRMHTSFETIALSKERESEDEQDALVRTINLLEVARDYHEQLTAEKNNSQKLQAQIEEDNERIEELSHLQKKLQAHNVQLQNVAETQEKSIEELQMNIEQLTSMTTLEEKQVQTIASGEVYFISGQESKDLQKELDFQVKRNFLLTQDFSKEVANSQSLRNQLNQTEREVRQLRKCIEQVEQQKAGLVKQNEKLLKDLANLKDQYAIIACKQAGGTSTRPPKLRNTDLERQAKVATKSSRKEEQLQDLIVKRDRRLKGDEARVHQLCHKIQETGLKSLNGNDLTYLYQQVYKAGKNIKIVECESPREKCREFVAKLPPIPTNREETIMVRVNYLETELDNARQVLQYLKMEYEKESRSDAKERHRGGEDKIPPRYLNYEITSWTKEIKSSF